MNYTEEVTAFLVEKYTENPCMETVVLLAAKYDKTIKSIIGKLSREGVYQRAHYTSKSGKAPITKVELVNNIAENLGIEVESLVGLEKSPKAALKELEQATGAQQNREERSREPWHNRSQEIKMIEESTFWSWVIMLAVVCYLLESCNMM